MIHIGDSKTFHFQFLAIQAYFSMTVLLRYAFGRHKAVLSPCAPRCSADVPRTTTNADIPCLNFVKT